MRAGTGLRAFTFRVLCECTLRGVTSVGAQLRFEDPFPRIREPEGWESGRIRQFGELVYPLGYRGFKSRPLRHRLC
jgi:hypothetical protein